MVERPDNGRHMRHELPSGRRPTVITPHDSPVKPPPPAFNPTSKSSPSLSPRDTIRLPQDLPCRPSTPSYDSSPIRKRPYNNTDGERESVCSKPPSDTEKGRLKPPRSPPRSSRRSSPDPEKGSSDGRSMRSDPSSNFHSHHSTVIYEEEEDGDAANEDPKHHAVWILFYLSLLSPLLTMVITLYTLILCILALFIFPICYGLWHERPRDTLIRFLIPPLHFQLGLIFSLYDVSPDPAHPPSSASLLLAIHFFGPIVATCVAVAAWVAAAFWLFAKILGVPGSNSGGFREAYHEEEKNEGRGPVLGIRNFWERYLLRGLS